MKAAIKKKGLGIFEVGFSFVSAFHGGTIYSNCLGYTLFYYSDFDDYIFFNQNNEIIHNGPIESIEDFQEIYYQDETKEFMISK